MMDYQWIRSGRKTIAVQIKEDGQIVVRSPYNVSKRQVEQFLSDKKAWIEKHQQMIREEKENRLVISDEQRRAGIEKAMKVFPERIAYYADIMGVTYGKVTLREQKTRWGSCSSNGNLNFNWKLVLLQPELLDYVVVHELAHRIEMNHSKAFWKIVEGVLPDYKVLRKQLKAAIIQ